MPLFSLRSSSPPRSPSTAQPAPNARVLFAGHVWVPAAEGLFSFAFGSKWTSAAVALWMAPVANDHRALVHLQLMDRVYVVHQVHLHPPSPDHKTMITLTVKALEDAERAVRYHTAAASSQLNVFIDGDDSMQAVFVSTLRQLLAPPSPPVRMQTAAPLPSVQRAQASTHMQKPVPTTAAVQLPQQRTQCNPQVELEKSLPVAVLDIPSASMPSQTQTSSIDDRLKDLQAFVHGQEVEQARRDHSTSLTAISMRFQALKNEPTAVPSLDSLQQRLGRLRGEPSSLTVQPSATQPIKRLSAVDQIIQQAMDEVAMGIVDDDAPRNSSSDESSDSEDSDSDDSSDSDDHTHHNRNRRQRRRPRQK